MKKTPKARKQVSAEAIARIADAGADVRHFFTGKGRMVQPIQPLVRQALDQQRDQ